MSKLNVCQEREDVTEITVTSETVCVSPEAHTSIDEDYIDKNTDIHR